MSDGSVRATEMTWREGEVCPMCGGLGWVLDCNDLTKPGPRHVEFIRCFYPECGIDEQVERLVFKGIEFQEVVRHAKNRFVMSLGRPARSIDPDAPTPPTKTKGETGS